MKNLYHYQQPPEAVFQPYQRPPERPFTAEEKNRVTVLFGGLTHRHHLLISAAGRSLGYSVEYLPTPTKNDYNVGREYAATGMCNPLYFTLGSLINFLRTKHRENEWDARQVVDRFVYVIAGSCGPCRFGMYETQFRIALNRCGYEGFRVLTFEQKKLNQPSPHTGLVFRGGVFLPLFLAVLIADLLNELANQIRPYEVVEGQTEHVFGRITAEIAQFLEKGLPRARFGTWFFRILHTLYPGITKEEALQLLWVLRGKELRQLLRKAAATIDREIEVDYSQPKPICKITGEFWAQTTEGDGNFRMFSFLESEGAEVIVEPLNMWFLHLAATAWNRVYDEAFLPPCTFWQKVKTFPKIIYRGLRFRVAVSLITAQYNRLRRALGGTTLSQPNQFELQRFAERYYNRKCRGGESYLEIAKTIYYTKNRLAHCVLSLKPFGCLPSTQSDGAQAAVLADYPDILFAAVETAGEGDANAYSRVQMVLTEAKDLVRAEYRECLRNANLTPHDVTRFLEEHPDFRRPLLKLPKDCHGVSKASRLVQLITHSISTSNKTRHVE